MNLRIAIQKSGRLSEDSLKLLNDCGISVKSAGSKLRSQAENFPVEVYFLRDDDIPQYVQDGVADVGIVGENVLYEKCKNVEVVEGFTFWKAPMIKRMFIYGLLSLIAPYYECYRVCQSCS